MDDEKPEQDEALRLRTISEQKYNSSNLKSALKYAKRAHILNPNLEGLSEMLTAFKILRVASKSTTTFDGAAAAPPLPPSSLDWYKILQIEPFSHLNTIKKQYKKLALTLHPDKNRFVGSEEAFKLVGEAFRVMSDKIRRKDYDMKLRIAMQSAATEAVSPVETFWTACSTCRLLHQFDRKYLGHKLMCPNCKKSFQAMEVSEDAKVSENVEDGEEDDRIGASIARVRSRNSKGKRKMSSVGDVLKRSRAKIVGANREVRDGGGVIKGSKLKGVVKLRNVDGNRGVNSVRGDLIQGLRRADRRVMDKKEANGSWVEASKRSRSKRVKTREEEMMTLAEMKLLAKRKVNEEKMKLKLMEKEKEKEREKERGNEKEKEEVKENLEIIAVEKEEEREKEKKKEVVKEKRETHGVLERGTLEIERRMSECGNLDVMAVEDSDFYDFDKDRVERSFKKGQVWAIYDDGDGMPRHYGLIDEVVSVNPFEVKLSWLDLQNNGDEELICWEKFGFHISCGRFTVSKKTSVNSLNIFSHVVNCERAAREVYRIYPKKGSVWALYNENALDAEEKQMVKDKQCYDIVIFLTSYSEIHGLSMAYLEKVDGFKAVFKRREIGCHAIRWLEKDDVRLFSHQIPARKLSREEVSSLSKDCWELDPASLPPELLTIGRRG